MNSELRSDLPEGVRLMPPTFQGTVSHGIQCQVDTQPMGDVTILTSTLTADAPRYGVQAVLPLELDLDWQSYTIAPGALYNGNRFIVSD